MCEFAIPAEDKKKIVQFLLENSTKQLHANAWFSYHKMRVYLRTGVHYIEQNRYNRVIDIATVSIDDKRCRGKGLFKDFHTFILMIARNYNYQVIFVENVLNLQFEEFFKKRAEYKKYPGSYPEMPSYYQILESKSKR